MDSLSRFFLKICLLNFLPYIGRAFTSPVIAAIPRSSFATNLANPLIESSCSIATFTTPNIIDDYIHGQYAFMLPTATVVATSCQLAGIGGAALFSPIFLLIFPYLGPQYPLKSAAAALASALLTECFGFASGLSGYARRGLVDWEVAGRFLVASVPTALLGALSAKYVASNPILLQSLYATFMLGLSCYLLLAPRPEEVAKAAADEECEVDMIEKKGRAVRYKVAADGTEFSYLSPPSGGSKSGIMATSAGGSLTGLLGVGIGEVVLPQLVRGCCMPLPVAAGTSVAIVVTTALTAAVVQFLTLAASVEGSLVEGLVAVVPWNLVQYTVPGVLLGGQLAPFLASRGTFSDEEIERFAAILFAVVGISFAIKASTALVSS
mmetsp:Transcript_26165/g.39602  ORF Transcript_26165/g.39602 Transcript_26165/m.39602 type:complete len:380 (+) Transcript_26165:178-1317(+)|eukprot:CAMPEP_0178920328 /NCGR_PEP_ID=MMETSP0786-20121207/14945_1 /TAXON_ID=186022 /ORGANISM="Thalassionema frauenfeldii, Strain CCMP 1798" /LENGTH=379 /DNA_ID=CAMNT_0020594385 /DNA_START=102 /DNA_END=1244 /DNA_ORIENTATION=+